MRSPFTSQVSSASMPVSLIPSFSYGVFTQPWQQRLVKRIMAALMLIVAMFCLTGCGKQGPDSKLVKRAIALEFGQAQLELSQQLRTKVPTFRIERVAIAEQTPLRIEGQAAYRIQGQYDASVKFPDQRYRQENNDFDVYLQQQGDTDNWRLAIPQEDIGTANQTWQTYILVDPLAEST